MEVTSKIQNNNFKLKKKKWIICKGWLWKCQNEANRVFGTMSTSSERPLHWLLQRIQWQSNHLLLLPSDSRASPERDRWRWMPCSGLQYSTECFFLTGGLLLHRRKRIRGLRSQNVHDLQSFQSKSVNKYNSVSLHLDLLSSASVFRQTPRTHTLLCLEITFSHSPGCF